MSTSPTRHLLDRLVDELDQAGLDAWILVRDLTSGEEIGIRPDVPVPLASLVKVPLALATLEACRSGRLGATDRIEIAPGGGGTSAGPAGVSGFRNAASITIEDLVYLAVAVSDNAAADALFALTPPEAVTAELRRLGVDGIVVRHLMHELTSTPVQGLPEAALAQALAIDGPTASGGHRVPPLDVAAASTGTARALGDLLALVWSGEGRLDPAVGARVRELMAATVHRQRLAPDFVSDATTWSSKTGTLLNLRHEMGVVEHRDGSRYAVVALTRSRVPAAAQTAAEATIAHVARTMHDHLRARRWSC